MYKAVWEGVEIACGDHVIEVEGRLYFRPGDVRFDLLRPAPDRSICEWKGGEAEYFDIVVGHAVNAAAAWRYPHLGPAAQIVEGYVAFWRGVAVGWHGTGPGSPSLTIEAHTPNVAKALGATDIVWQPPLPVEIIATDSDPFAGYLIPSRRTLVNVVATPASAERNARIAEARGLAKRVARWNRTRPLERFAFAAVWGSAIPPSDAIARLNEGAVIVALTDPATTIFAD